jgi:hypothetical protein
MGVDGDLYDVSPELIELLSQLLEVGLGMGVLTA